MTLIKRVFKSMKRPEQRLSMSDHCSLMHRMDRPHQPYYIILNSVARDGKTDCTLQEFLDSDAGKKWSDKKFERRVKDYIYWIALRTFANPCNVETITSEIEHLSVDDTAERDECMECVRHALRRINCYQVRIFCAMLFDMCTVEQIKNVKDDTFVRDRVLRDKKHRAGARAFRMKLRWYDQNKMRAATRKEDELCYPLMCPPSGMQVLMNHLGMERHECQWTQHVNAGFCTLGEALAAKLSFWDFWKGNQRFCPLEQYATPQAVNKVHRRLLEAGLLKFDVCVLQI